MARIAYTFKKATKQIPLGAITLPGVEFFRDKKGQTVIKTPLESLNHAAPIVVVQRVRE